MIRRLINTLQGKQWGAVCHICHWSADRKDLTRAQAMAWSVMHRRTAHTEYGTCWRELTTIW